MTETAKQWSPKAKARLAGVFEALEGFTSSWNQVTVLGKLLVVGNATGTAANILQHETLFLWKAQAEGVKRSNSIQGLVVHHVCET